ncbi:hypothetical protein [Deinococcus indicus]|uniref:hypothetical protein n=1 Tax=Deinococcus indicus TaxID=223556 RepID=UPI0011780726|nr:hypothetical protein [Deinococcus indicus]
MNTNDLSGWLITLLILGSILAVSTWLANLLLKTVLGKIFENNVIARAWLALALAIFFPVFTLLQPRYFPDVSLLTSKWIGALFAAIFTAIGIGLAKRVELELKGRNIPNREFFSTEYPWLSTILLSAGAAISQYFILPEEVARWTQWTLLLGIVSFFDPSSRAMVGLKHRPQSGSSDVSPQSGRVPENSGEPVGQQSPANAPSNTLNESNGAETVQATPVSSDSTEPAEVHRK